MMVMMIHLLLHPPPPEPAPATASSTSAAIAAVTSTSTAGVSSKSANKKASTPPGDPDIVQLILQHQERSQAVAGELHQLVTQAAVSTNNRSAWATFLHSNLPLVHDCIWPLYPKMSMQKYLWALNESDTIHGSERQQLQCQQQQPQPPLQLPPSQLLQASQQLQPSHQLYAPQNLQPSHQLQVPQQ